MSIIICSSVLLCITFMAYAVLAKTAQFPSSFPRCSKSDPNFDRCLKNAIETGIKIAAEKGIPEVGLPKLEPLLVPEIVLDTEGETIKVVQKYHDIKLYGVGDTTVPSAHLDLDKKVLTFSTYTPVFRQVSSYTLEGRMLILPLYGNGSSELIPYNSTLDHTITFNENNSKSDKFFNVVSHTVDWKATGVHFGFENLFNGNKELSDNMLKVLNENWEAVWVDAKKGFEKAYGEVYRGLSSKFFKSVPIDQIFLE